VGGFGVSAPEDPLLVEDIHLVQQYCSVASVKFDDAAVADFFDDQVDRGLAPEHFGRIWIHTHPGNSPLPSNTDEATFARCFGAADWAVMFVLACGGQSYARLRFSAGPGASLILPVEVDFAASFPAAAPAVWDAEYRLAVVADMGWMKADKRSVIPDLAAAKGENGGTRAFDDLLYGSACSNPWEALDDRIL
jgi:hypothetical protein